MNKDTNIRIIRADRKLLRKIARREGRTLKVMFGIMVRDWVDFNVTKPNESAIINNL